MHKVKPEYCHHAKIDTYLGKRLRPCTQSSLAQLLQQVQDVLGVYVSDVRIVLRLATSGLHSLLKLKRLPLIQRRQNYTLILGCKMFSNRITSVSTRVAVATGHMACRASSYPIS
ncbi:hypothetical protein TNIN_29581 [Trichonephila inaurata madagascariensis]|uniref:Uncharacterized protein n=1 Tax=Trichonephila inaurata madagascariensis TaxID=2747483 RepID=A0A8X6Y3N5_9ARAC|nr:hypothetical protein TNIN_29581 [Trichonephila inaurata madagascariensis]